MGTCFNKFLKWYNDFPSVISSTKKIFLQRFEIKNIFYELYFFKAGGKDESMCAFLALVKTHIV